MRLPPEPQAGGNAPGDGPLRRGGQPRKALRATGNDLPSTPSKAATRQAPAVATMRDLWGGDAAVKAEGMKYLPKAPLETAPNYGRRLARSVFHNFFRRTVEALVGFVFRVDPVLSDDVPPVIREHAENIDNAGTHLDVFLRDTFADAMTVGHAAIHVEYPDVGGGLSMEAEKNLKVRPYWLPLKKENLLSWRTTIEHGRVVLTQLVVREITTEPDGAFGEAEVTRYRVFYRQRLVVEGGERVIVGFELLRVTDRQAVVREGWGLYSTQEEIPVVEVPTAGRIGLFESDPPLADVAALNIAHYQQWSDYANSLHKTSVPIFFTAGFKLGSDDGAPVPIGTDDGINTEAPGAKAEYVSHDGAALTACKVALDDLKHDIGSLGLAMLAPQQRTAETLGAKRLDRQGEESTLSVSARALQDATERALAIHAKYLRLPSGGSIVINRDFEGSLMDAATMVAYATLADTLGIPDETVIEMLVRGGRLPEDTNVEEMADAMRGARAAREDVAQVNNLLTAERQAHFGQRAQAT